MVGVNQQVSHACGCYKSEDGSAVQFPGTGPVGESRYLSVAVRRCQSYRAFRKKSPDHRITSTEAPVHIRRTRYYGINDRPISLVFVECISDEHPELLDAPAPQPQDAAVAEADEPDPP